jgi:hypothetical protein
LGEISREKAGNGEEGRTTFQAIDERLGIGGFFDLTRRSIPLCERRG